MENQLTLIVAAKWQQFMNSKNIDEMLKLTHEQIKFFYLNEHGNGHKELADWILRTGLTLTTLKSQVNEDKLLLKHFARLKGEDGSLLKEESFYTYIKMNRGKIIYIARLENQHDAEVISGISLET